MKDPFIWIFIGEVIIVLLLIVIRVIFKYYESKRVDKILDTFKELSSTKTKDNLDKYINKLNKEDIKNAK